MNDAKTMLHRMEMTDMVFTDFPMKWDKLTTDERQAFEQYVFDFQQISVIHRSAIKEVNTKLEILNDEFSSMHERNPIKTIQSRVKTPMSIMEKLNRRGFEISLDSALEHLNDIAGIRVICSYIKDVYMIADMLKSQEDIILIEEKDYIANMKPNGYRSLHLILSVPVFLSDRVEHANVEVQLRTIAMDYWASLEHQLGYKPTDKTSVPMFDELSACARAIADVEVRMQSLHDDFVKDREKNKTRRSIIS